MLVSFNANLRRSIMTEIPGKLAFSVREACAASSLGRTSIYGHIAAGRLKAVKVGGRTVIPADSLQALLSGEAA